MSRPFSRNQPQQPLHRVNGRIRAREVRVIGPDGQQVGVIDLPAALNMARAQGVDLVEVAPNAVPPVCRMVDYGKFKYELAKKDRDSKKHQHVNLVKEVQLSARIDPHDMGIKLAHAIGFLCEDMKVKITLRFRGREMAHTEIGRQVVTKFLSDLDPWGHADSPPKLIGRSINVMVSPHPKHKRAKNPHAGRDLPPNLIIAQETVSDAQADAADAADDAAVAKAKIPEPVGPVAVAEPVNADESVTTAGPGSDGESVTTSESAAIPPQAGPEPVIPADAPEKPPGAEADASSHGELLPT